MYKREFDARLQQGIPKAILLYGENDYLLQHYTELITERLQAKESAQVYYFDEYDFDAAKAYLSQSSLFGGINLLILKHDKKIPKKELETLISLCTKKEDSYLLYLYYGSAKDAKSLQGTFSEKKGGVWVRFFEPDIREATGLLHAEAERLGLAIDGYTLQHLLHALQNNLALAKKELEKLAVFDRPVTSKDIDASVYSLSAPATETLLMELFEKRPVTQTLSKLLEMGEDEFAVLRAIAYFVEQIFLFNAYIKLHGRIDSAEILGYKLPKRIEEQKARLAARINSATLLKICETILEGEERLKQSSGKQKEVLLYGLLIKIQSFL